MENKKILLVLDWSNLLFRSLFMNSLYNSTNGYNDIDELRSFIYKFATDVCSLLNIFKPANVIIATDSQHAWRKDILPGENGYKSNRHKSEFINWDNVFKCSEELLTLLKSIKIHTTQIEHSEADDIAAMCKELIFEKYNNYNIIIISADADIRQLIDFNEITKQYCLVYNTTGKGKGSKRYLYGTHGFVEWINSKDNVDIFFEGEDLNKQYIRSILNNNKVIELVEENPNDVVLDKIFCGDDGDCVPSFYDWYKNDKFVRITPAKAKKIRTLIGINTVKDLIDSEQTLQPVFEKVCKKDINDIDFHERLIRQRTLVELNSSLFPENIRNYKDTISYMINDIPPTGFWNVKASALLENTQFANANRKKHVEKSVFRDMDKYLGLNLV